MQRAARVQPAPASEAPDVRTADAAAHARSPAGRFGAAFGLSLSAGTIFLPVIAAALWVLTHPYRGIIGDASIYIGRALADLDPQGVGRDLLFTHDGQFGFSLYPRLVKALVILVGTDRAALALVAVATALWIAAAATLARRFVDAPRAWIVVAFLALLPINYGAPQRFSFSEALAVPRPMAEALVLFALASLVGGRTIRTFVLLIAATLVHPLMALAGWAAVGLALALEDRRWWIAAAIGAGLIALGAAFGVPLLDRLAEPMAADVKALAASRSPQLFPTLWQAKFVGPIIAQMAAILVAASLYRGRQRGVLVAAMFAGIFGIAVQALGGDLMSSLLIIQAQLWRMAWLTAAMGAFALGLCALELWRRAPIDRVVLALLAMTWLAADDFIAAALFAVAALGLHYGRKSLNWQPSPRAVMLVWAAAGLFALYANVGYLTGFAHFVAQMPAGAEPGYSYFWNQRYLAFPALILLTMLMLPQRASLLVRTGRALTALALAGAALYFWDGRSAFQRMVDAQEHPPELMRAIAARPGEILWIGGFGEAWYLTGRPQWVSPQQGVASVFSRELALAWRDRISFLRDAGLADRNVLSAQQIPSSAELAHLSEAGVTRLCTRTDAPAWIVAPVESGAKPFGTGNLWHLPQPVFRITDEGDSYAWHRTDEFLILACAAPRSGED